MLLDEFGIDAAADREAIVFAGDSPNDAPMFSYFPNSVGVANIVEFKDSLPAAPTWVTTKTGGQGFAELVSQLLKK
jgi:hydroxymethylpyrimidine pyrophosphatase-like HAD family hydrolase